jgi:hypothetical protein
MSKVPERPLKEQYADSATTQHHKGTEAAIENICTTAERSKAKKSPAKGTPTHANHSLLQGRLQSVQRFFLHGVSYLSGYQIETHHLDPYNMPNLKGTDRLLLEDKKEGNRCIFMIRNHNCCVLLSDASDRSRTVWSICKWVGIPGLAWRRSPAHTVTQ